MAQALVIIIREPVPFPARLYYECIYTLTEDPCLTLHLPKIWCLLTLQGRLKVLLVPVHDRHVVMKSQEEHDALARVSKFLGG